MLERNKEGICLCPSNTRQYGYKFLCLNYTRVVTRHNFTEIPMSEEVIQRVAAITADECQPGALTFAESNGNNNNTNTINHNAELSGLDVDKKETIDPDTKDPQQLFDQEQEQLQLKRQ